MATYRTRHPQFRSAESRPRFPGIISPAQVDDDAARVNSSRSNGNESEAADAGRQKRVVSGYPDRPETGLMCGYDTE